MELGDPTTCVYQFIFDEMAVMKKNIKYFIMHGLGLCMIKYFIFFLNTAISTKKN